MSFKDYLPSERIVFGVIIIGGFVSLLHEVFYAGKDLPPEMGTLLSAGLGALGTGVGIIVQSIWKTDKTAAAQSEALMTIAAQVGTGSGGSAPAMAAEPKSNPSPQSGPDP
jgi:hypothetical protein